tara:strand:- start:27113 stop:27730 length:618 start_codon:yes stop_codon:yes gene_type:complete
MDLMKEIPKEVWGTAVDIINKLLYPVTATTVGVGKLIEQKFTSLSEIQKVIAEKTLKEAIEKAKSTSQNKFDRVIVKPQVIWTVLDNTDGQVNDDLRGLWSNLAARELTEGSIHPEIIGTFAKLTAPDLITLSSVYEQNQSKGQFLLKVLLSSYSLGINKGETTFNHIHLQNLGLIESLSGHWAMTIKGRELMKSISELEDNSPS